MGVIGMAIREGIRSVTSLMLFWVVITALAGGAMAGADPGTAFDAPFRTNPDRGKEIRTEATGEQEGESASDNALYRLEAYDEPQRSVSVFRINDNVRLLNITFTGDAAWGFSPDQHRFVIHFFDGGQHTIRMYNLEGAQPDAPPVWPLAGTPDSSPWTATSSRVAFSKDGKYLFYAAMANSSSFSLRVVEAATGAVRHSDNYSGTFTGVGAGWGFSPGEDRFLIHYYDGDTHRPRLYNLDGAQPDDGPVWSNDVHLDGGDTSRLWFSRGGEYLLYAVLQGGNQLTKWVVDTSTGSVPYDTIPPITIGQPPGHQGDRIDSATWGFTRDASAFLYAYYRPDGQVTWGLVALPSGNHDMGPSTFSAVWDRWRFCRFGDAMGIASWTNTQMGIRLVRLSDGAELYRSDTFHQTTGVEFSTTDTLYIARIDGVQYNLAPRAGEDTEAPTWPSGSSVSFSNVKHNSLTVSWPAANDNVGVTEYRLLRNGDEIAEVGPDERSHAVTGLSAQTSYTFAVEAVDGAGNRSAKLQRSITTPQAPPPTWPAGSTLSATQLEGSPPFQVLLEWNAAEDEDVVTAYRVYQDGVRIHTLEVQGEPDEVSYVVPGLEMGLELGETYTFRIQAGNPAGSWSTNGPQTSLEIVYLPPPSWHPDAELLVSEVGPRHVAIQWPEAIQADYVARYEYFRSYTYMGSIDPSVTSPVDGFFSVSIDGLWWDTEYTFRIVAYDEDGNVSEFLASDPVRTLDRDKTDPPEWPPGSTLSAGAMSSMELTLNWTEAEDDEGVGYYQVFMGNTRIATVSGSETSYEVTDLRPGRAYVFTLQAGDYWDNWTTDGPSLSVTMDTDPPEPEVMPERELIISFPFPEGPYWYSGSGGAVPVISGDGNIVAFSTVAADLVPGVGNAYRQVYVYNRQTDELEVVSVSSGGTLGDNHSFTPALSADGRYVAFASSATNLHPRAEDSWSAVYVRDRQTNTTEMVSFDMFGKPLDSVWSGPLNPPAISADGRFVVFGGYLHDRVRRRTEPINRMPSGQGTSAEKASISADGRYVVFTTNYSGGSVRVYDRWSGRVIIVTDDGLPPDISGDGNVVIHENRPQWYEPGGDYYPLFAQDVPTGDSEFVAWASSSAMAYHEDKTGPVINHDGRYIAFSSEDSSLDPCGFRLGKDVYVYDRWESEIELISYFSRDEYWGGPQNLYPSISADGQMLVFENMYWDYGREQYMAYVYWHKRGNVDVRPPCWHWSVPFEAVEIGEDYATLQWGRASDNTGVTAYRLYQDEVLIATLDADDELEFHEYTVTDLVKDQPYVFTIQAGDAAGNWSTDGPSVQVILGDWYRITTAMEPSQVGGIHLTETGPFQPGTEVGIRATAWNPHRFLYWTASAGAFADPEAAETIFTMPDQNVTITANIGVDERGAIRVTMEPAAARDAEAKWRLTHMDSWCDSGYTLYPFPLGDYVVEFSEIEGWTRPASIQVTVEELETAIVQGTYVADASGSGALQVMLEPPAAVDAGARWRPIGADVWLPSEHIEDLEPGAYTVEFKAIAGWETPELLSVTIVEDETEILTGEYAPLIGVGSLTVTITPADAVLAGAAWSADGGQTWRDSGAPAALAPGAYTVEFKAIDQWLTPNPQDVMVEADKTAEVAAAYVDFGITGVDRLLGLSLGGNVVTLNAVGLTENTRVYIGAEPAFLLEDESDIGQGVLVVETPSQWPGDYDIRLEEPASGSDHVFAQPFRYISNPFEEGADQFPGAMRLIQDSPYRVSTSAGSLPMVNGQLRPLEYETPEGIVIEVPVEALPMNATGAFVVLRSADQAHRIFERDESLPRPEEHAPRPPYVDAHILVELDGSDEAYELVNTENAPVTLRFPHLAPSTGWDALRVGEMITNLDEQFQPLLPEPVEIQLSHAPIVEVDENWAVAEVEHFTVYGLLGPAVYGDVTGNGIVNAQDIQIVINRVLGLPVDPRHDPDVTGDGVVNAHDIQAVINVVLGIR